MAGLTDRCTYCNGDGWTWLAGAPAHPGNQIKCEKCNGTGKVHTELIDRECCRRSREQYGWPCHDSSKLEVVEQGSFAKSFEGIHEKKGTTFQSQVDLWMKKCFEASVISDVQERGDRFLEEALELLQASGYDRNRVAGLVSYVFDRPVGDKSQEVGGVMVTLSAFCSTLGIDMQKEGDIELARINDPAVLKKIQAKQKAKALIRFDSPLPGSPANDN